MDTKIWLVDIFNNETKKFIATYKKAFSTRQKALKEMELLNENLCFQIYYVELV